MKTYKIVSIELGPMQNLIYLIHDLSSQRIAVVDPAWDIDRIMTTAQQQQGKITDIILTHTHHDHVNGLNDLLAQTDAQLHLLKAEAKFWGGSVASMQLHHGGDIVQLGDTEITLLHTPGHTPGSVCLSLGDDLITGDTLFIFGCGRCDLPGGDAEQMYGTLKNLTNSLPTNTRILPGHNFAHDITTSWGEQITGNPFLHFNQINSFVKYRIKQHDAYRNTPFSAVDKTELQLYLDNNS